MMGLLRCTSAVREAAYLCSNNVVSVAASTRASASATGISRIRPLSAGTGFVELPGQCFHQLEAVASARDRAGYCCGISQDGDLEAIGSALGLRWRAG
jgi:hypothetical protein